MKRLKRVWGLALLLLMLMSVSGVGLSAVHAQDNDGTAQATVAPDLVYVREAPGTSSAIVTEYPRGLLLNVDGREDEAGNGGLWVRVTPASGGETGWVLIDLLNFDPSFVISSLRIIDLNNPDAVVSSSPAASTDDTDTTDTSDTTAETTTTTTTTTTTSTAVGDNTLPGNTNQLANLRNGPELTYDIVEQFPGNTDALFLGRNANGVWLYAVIEGQAGWFFSGLVDVDGDPGTLYELNPDGTRADTGEAVVTTTTTGGVEAIIPAAGSSSNMALQVKPGTNPNSGDGRLNSASNDLGTVLVYCVDENGYTNAGNYNGGGIAVYRFQGEDQGIVLFAPAAIIDGAKSTGASGALASGNGYNLYYVEDDTLQLTGTDSGGKTFIFEWENCNMGGRID